MTRPIQSLRAIQHTPTKVPSYVPAHLRDRYVDVVINSQRDRGTVNFWVGEDWMREFQRADRESISYAMKLASVRRGIANFVRIMTKRDIPVVFSTGQQSFATHDKKDREVIVISATRNPRYLDANVGTALHEAAHMILSKVNDGVTESIPLYDWIPYLKNHGNIWIPSDLFDLAAKIKRAEKVKHDLKMVINVLEDRRIDNWMYENAKGYRMYYDALYATGWNRPLISKALVHPLGRREIWGCYELHFMHMTNPLWDADALPGLRDIAEMVDLKNIRRFGHDVKWGWWNPVRWKLISMGAQDFERDDMPDMIQTACNILRVMYANSKLPSKEVMQFAPELPGGAPAPSEDDEERSPIIDMSKDGEGEIEAIEEDEVDEKGQLAMNPFEEEMENEPGQTAEFDNENWDSPDEHTTPTEQTKDHGRQDDNAEESESESPEQGDERRTDIEDDDDHDLETDEDRNVFGDEEDEEGEEFTDDEEGDEEEDEASRQAEAERHKAEREAAAREAQAKEDEENIEHIQDSEDFDNVMQRALDEDERMADGDHHKETISEAQQQALQAISESGATMHRVGRGLGYHVNVVVFSKLTNGLINSKGFGFSAVNQAGYAQLNQLSKRAVEEGERLGEILTHKLRVIGEETVVKYNRRHHGQIDKRRLAGLGHGAEDVFVHSVVELHKPVFLHLSIDGSASMSFNNGVRWFNALKLGAALAKAATKIPKLDVVISLRGSGEGANAQVAIIFDSRTDKYAKVRSQWMYLSPVGGTPEGLCFEAIHEIMDSSNNTSTRKFFVNISDGEPAFLVPATEESSKTTSEHYPGYHAYTGEAAYKHTREQVRALEGSGITVLSYFVGDTAEPSEAIEAAFRQMYGRAATFIDPSSITAIALTLNKMFLE